MAYVSLYRRYRPATFADVVGQEHVTRTLTHALEEGRLHHAYLFTGPRGTGKTSTARILAKAVNCEQGPTPQPCGVCDQCVAISEGSAVDVIELDMASHGGVDDARELRDRALFAPASGRYKLYILDEVHMASTAAFNALLKLIEEPPAHVLFAMATTDPQKVLPTILSRVQRLDLRRVAADEVGAHVRRVCDAEGFRIDDHAVEAVVRAGDGSVRDTLSVLEQVLAFAGAQARGDGQERVTAETVAGVLGHTPLERVVDAVDRLGERDLAGLLGLVQDLADGGHDLRRFTLDLVQHLRDLVVLQVAPDRPDLVDATDDRRRRLQAQTAVLGRESLLRAVARLADTLAEQRQGSPRLPLELALATLATPGADGDVAELADRLARLEAGTPRSSSRAAAPVAPVAPVAPAGPEPASPSASAAPVESDPPASAAPAPVAPPQAADPQTTAPPEPAPPEPVSAEPAPPEPASAGPAMPADGSEDDDPFARVEANWEAILGLVKDTRRSSHAMYLPATPLRVRNRILTLRYAKRYASFHAENAVRGEHSDVLVEAIERSTGCKLRIEAVIEGDDARRPSPPSVTPDDARTPMLDRPAPSGGPAVPPAPAVSDPPDDPDAPSASEIADVREAEAGHRADAGEVTDELLASELGAELLEHRPATGEG